MSYRPGPVTTSLVASKQPEVIQEDVSSRSDQAFRFLDLPAELRNMVYAYCEESFQFYFQRRINLSWQNQLNSCIQGYPDAWSVARGLKHFNLTRVCRQIRTEFMSMYLSHNYKYVDVKSVTKYFAAFHRNEGIADHVTIEIHSILPVQVRYDLLPIFRHLADYPGVKCDFDVTNLTDAQYRVRYPNILPIMSKVAAHSGAVEFKAAMDNVVSITPNSKAKTIMVVLKYACKLKTQQRKEFETAFRNAIDLQDMAPWRVLIKYGWV